ncbi:MAG: hypothetical protein ACI95C_001203 [Pseudohongiellaceae bacterium]|jgi:hypothetical protein
MTMFIFLGDMLVMAFMIGVAIWFGTRGSSSDFDDVAAIPLQDDVLDSDLKPSKGAAKQ